MKICSGHSEYQTPLIWTFAFIGAEYWCPYCGYISGMLGAGTSVPETPELEERHNKFKEFSSDYLHAKGTQICAYTLWEGKKIKPFDLPQQEKDRLSKIIDEWRYNVKL